MLSVLRERHPGKGAKGNFGPESVLAKALCSSQALYVMCVKHMFVFSILPRRFDSRLQMKMFFYALETTRNIHIDTINSEITSNTVPYTTCVCEK